MKVISSNPIQNDRQHALSPRAAPDAGSGGFDALIARGVANARQRSGDSATRFDDAGLFDTLQPQPTHIDPAPRQRNTRQEPKATPCEPPTAQPPPDETRSQPRSHKLADSVRDHDGRALIPPSTARRIAPSLAQAQSKTRTIDAKPAPSTPRPAPAKPRTAQQSNSIFVALHAVDTSYAVFARLGRMAPTNRESLRNAIGALFAEFGHCDVAVTFDQAAEEISWRK